MCLFIIYIISNKYCAAAGCPAEFLRIIAALHILYIIDFERVKKGKVDKTQKKAVR